MSKAQPIAQAAPVTLDLSKAQPINPTDQQKFSRDADGKPVRLLGRAAGDQCGTQCAHGSIGHDGRRSACSRRAWRRGQVSSLGCVAGND